MGDTVRLVPGRWLVRFDARTREWYAMPMWRIWTAEASFKNGSRGTRFGPIGSKAFDTLRAAMDFANDPHQAHVDGWMP